jgi:hypothetical protein
VDRTSHRGHGELGRSSGWGTPNARARRRPQSGAADVRGCRFGAVIGATAPRVGQRARDSAGGRSGVGDASVRAPLPEVSERNGEDAGLEEVCSGAPRHELPLSLPGLGPQRWPLSPPFVSSRLRVFVDVRTRPSPPPRPELGPRGGQRACREAAAGEAARRWAGAPRGRCGWYAVERRPALPAGGRASRPGDHAHPPGRRRSGDAAGACGLAPENERSRLRVGAGARGQRGRVSRPSTRRGRWTGCSPPPPGRTRAGRGRPAR